MDKNEAVLCARCSAEVGVIFYQGFVNGRRVLKPFVLKREGAWFVFVQCPLHGQMAQQIAERECPREIVSPNGRERARKSGTHCKRASCH
jgi:hypothetical protein